ncbi:MAG: ABC transporter ATP-binding protein [Spirochaetaceae bacterium]|jgi:zinc transport system ATP-binding protein|nr:ABC transporter ATP-binding protein [Spirochaetaceae bacterium]
MADNSENIFEVQNAAFAYDGHVVLENLSFSIRRGDYLCISGENGSGKTTLIKGLLGLIKPVQGKIIKSGLKPYEIAYVPQQTNVQKDFPAGVFEVVLSGRLALLGVRPFYSRKDKEAAEASLHQLGAFDIRNTCYRELSGGQQQRVLLARALCSNPKAILLDEPAAGLDPLVAEDLYSHLRTVNSAGGMAVIMVSHDMRRAVESAKKILHLQKTGFFFGTTTEYRKLEEGRRFLGETDTK